MILQTCCYIHKTTSNGLCHWAMEAEVTNIKQAWLSDVNSSNELTTNVNLSSLKILLDLLASNDSHNHLTQEKYLESTVLLPPNESNIKGYIDYLGIDDRKHTIDILMNNGFHSHKYEHHLSEL
ncbi:hypothetical protein VP01_251g1 [Puccinia sorghi]|uniref:Uncharacterized protein n=1 Tax=Puccinia sorghi TaxID=27349 RepID=A0A0L6V5L8_9BASI|nr:hypothetical protein VP01_251g1 [Puccinia sorghi]